MISSVFTTAMIRSVTDAVETSEKSSSAVTIARAQNNGRQTDIEGDRLRSIRCVDAKFIDADVETMVSRIAMSGGSAKRYGVWPANDPTSCVSSSEPAAMRIVADDRNLAS